jgi:hypothetical protein
MSELGDDIVSYLVRVRSLLQGRAEAPSPTDRLPPEHLGQVQAAIIRRGDALHTMIKRDGAQGLRD